MTDDIQGFSHTIRIPGGDVLVPRKEFANKKMKVSDRTAARKDYLTIYVGNVAYIPLNASLRELADGAKRRHQPQRQLRQRRAK
jgi:hypothetical protein